MFITVRDAERVQALAGAAGCNVRRPVVCGMDRCTDGRSGRRRAGADWIRPLVDMVVAVDDEVDVILVEEWRPELANATFGSVRGARAVAAVVEEHHDEVDARI